MNVEDLPTYHHQQANKSGSSITHLLLHRLNSQSAIRKKQTHAEIYDKPSKVDTNISFPKNALCTIH